MANKQFCMMVIACFSELACFYQAHVITYRE